MCPTAAIADPARGFYGVQFHPEVNHTEHGTQMIRNFLYQVCHAKGDWTMEDYCRTAIAAIREKVGDGKVCWPSPAGVDSSVVAAALLAEAVGKQLTCVFVDHGLMRLHEGDEVEAAFAKWDIRFLRVDAESRFLLKLAGVDEPERKRKIIGEEFIRVFEEESQKIGAVDFLAQGTIYPDVIESGAGEAATIKSHHNVGGLPDFVDFQRDHRASADALQRRSPPVGPGAGAAGVPGQPPALRGPGRPPPPPQREHQKETHPPPRAWRTS